MNNPTNINFKPEDMIALRGTMYKPTHYTLLLRLNDNCNLDCLYCTMHNTSDNKSYQTDYKNIMEYIKITFDKILSLNKFLSIDYYFYGGEPTMYKDFEKLVEAIHNLHLNSNLDYLIETQTNLTKPIVFFERMKQFNIKFICSYQNAAQNQLYSKHPNGSEEHYIQFYKKSEFLMDNNMTHGFDIMLEDPKSIHYTNSMDKPNPNEIISMYRDLKNLFFDLDNNHNQTKFGLQMNTIDSVSLPEIYQEIYDDHKVVSEKLWVTLKDTTEKVIAFNDIISDEEYNNFRFWYCDVGLRQFMISFINEQPDVWWCMADMFAKTKSLATNLNEYKQLIDSTFDKNKSPRCIHRRCTCELFIPKRKNK